MSGAMLTDLFVFRKLCGREGLSSVILATTMWDHVRASDGDRREAELKTTDRFWGDMVRVGSRVMRHTNDRNSALNIIDSLIVRNMTTVLEIQREMVDEKKSLENTAAGHVLESKMVKERHWAERNLELMRKDMEKAIASNDKEMAEEIAKEQQTLEAWIDAIEGSREMLQHTHAEELITERIAERVAGKEETVAKVQALESNDTTAEWRPRDSDQASITNPSYAASVFSTALSEESALSQPSLENIRSAKHEMVLFFLSDAELRPLFVSAVQDPTIGGDRLERNFRRLLADYSAELLAITNVKVYREAAKLVRSSAAFISERIHQHFEPESLGDSSVPGLKIKIEDEIEGRRHVLNQYLEESLREHHRSLNKSTLDSEVEMKAKPVHRLDNTGELKQEELDRLSEIFSEPAEDEASIVTALDQVKEFLGSGPPLANLRTGLRNFVSPRLKLPEQQARDKADGSSSEPEPPEAASEPRLPVQGIPRKTSLASFPDFVDCLLDFLALPSWESPLPPGKDRVRWKCVCIPLSNLKLCYTNYTVEMWYYSLR